MTIPLLCGVVNEFNDDVFSRELKYIELRIQQYAFKYANAEIDLLLIEHVEINECIMIKFCGNKIFSGYIREIEYCNNRQIVQCTAKPLDYTNQREKIIEKYPIHPALSAVIKEKHRTHCNAITHQLRHADDLCLHTIRANPEDNHNISKQAILGYTVHDIKRDVAMQLRVELHWLGEEMCVVDAVEPGTSIHTYTPNALMNTWPVVGDNLEGAVVANAQCTVADSEWEIHGDVQVEKTTIECALSLNVPCLVERTEAWNVRIHFHGDLNQLSLTDKDNVLASPVKDVHVLKIDLENYAKKYPLWESGRDYTLDVYVLCADENGVRLPYCCTQGHQSDHDNQPGSSTFGADYWKLIETEWVPESDAVFDSPFGQILYKQLCSVIKQHVLMNYYQQMICMTCTWISSHNIHPMHIIRLDGIDQDYLVLDVIKIWNQKQPKVILKIIQIPQFSDKSIKDYLGFADDNPTIIADQANFLSDIMYLSKVDQDLQGNIQNTDELSCLVLKVPVEIAMRNFYTQLNIMHDANYQEESIVADIQGNHSTGRIANTKVNIKIPRHIEKSSNDQREIILYGILVNGG